MTSQTEDVSPAETDSILGKVIAGNFRVDRLIGSGAMGNVYQAQQLSLGKAVAIKILHPHLMGDEKLVWRFQREAKSASRLNHPNSVQIIDSGHDASGIFYIAMELLIGRDLSQIIRDEFPLPLPRIIRIMSQVLSALDEAHAQGVIHRDLKPGNIMLIERRGEQDFVKVCDYGIAKAQIDESQAESQMLTVQGLVCGTPEYMSPEQARGETLDGRSDLYSVAVILYHMVTGDIPFRAATPIGIVSRHLSEAPVVPSARRPDPAIPADLDDLILRGLAKSRDLRPISAAIFREELENIGSGRVGRRERSSQNTVPATQSLSGDGQTMAMSVAASPPRRTGKNTLWLVGVVLASAVAGAAVFKRVRAPEVAGAETNAKTTSAAPAPSTAAAARQVPVALPVPPVVQPTGGDDPPGDNGAARAGSVSPESPPPVPPTQPASAGARAMMKTRRTAALPRADRNVQKRPEESASPAGTSLAVATTTAPLGPNGPATTAGGSAVPRASTQALTASPGPNGSDDNGKETAAAAGVGAHAARDGITDAEQLLAQGDVNGACRRGEDAKKVGPRVAAIYKFLGKCYMRAGDPARARENYRRYLDLAPGAPDAMFIESIVK